MTEVVGPLATSSHPESNPDAAWELTEEVIDSFVQQGPGLPVTVNYGDRVVGQVISVEKREGGASVRMRLDDESVGVPGWRFGPGMLVTQQLDGRIQAAVLKSVSLLETPA